MAAIGASGEQAETLGKHWSLGAGAVRPVEVSTFGHFLTRRAGRGKRGEEKDAAQEAGALPAATRLPGPSAPKCPKAAIPIVPKIKSAFP